MREIPGPIARTLPSRLARRGRLGRRLGLTLVVVASSFPLGLGADPQEKPGCRQVPWTASGPRWVSSMAWSGDGQRLLLPDPSSGYLYEVDLEGKLVERHHRPGKGDLEYDRPAELRRQQGNLVLRNGSHHLLWLAPDLTPQKARRLPEAALFNWTFDGGEILAYGDVRQGEDWRPGFFRIDPSGGDASNRRPRWISHPPVQRPERDLLTFGFPLLTTVGGEGFVLRLTPTPAIHRLGAETSQPLAAFPAGFDRTPELPTLRFETVPLVGRALRRNHLAVGLFSDPLSPHLVVLTRQPAPDGATHWQLTGVDPRRDRVLGTVRLPLAGAHLVVAPGPESWAFVEKGEIQDAGTQDLTSLTLIPAKALSRALGVAGSSQDICL